MEYPHKRQIDYNEAAMVADSLIRDMPYVRLTKHEWDQVRAFIVTRISNTTLHSSPAGVPMGIEIDSTKGS